MSGHSKWSQIKRQKGVLDQKRGALFTKLGNAITIAAKEGGNDPSANFKLRLAVDTAKSANMPKDNIERSIKRGTGELKGEEVFKLQYEAFGPGGVAVIIKALSDNKNRTASEIKHILNKHHAKLGVPGSVVWQFKEKGVISIDRRQTQTKSEINELTLRAIDAGAEDVVDNNSDIVIYTNKEQLQSVKEKIEQMNFETTRADIKLVPDSYIQIDDNARVQLEKLLKELENCEDVNACYHNGRII